MIKTIKISAKSAKAVKDVVDNGLYPDESSFVDNAIARAIQADQQKMEKLRAAIAVGIEQADCGEYSSRTIDEIIVEAKARKEKKKQ